MSDSLLPQADREFILRVVRDEGTKTRREVGALADRVGRLEAQQATASQTDLQLHSLILETSRTAGREGSEASGRKWSVINGAIVLLTMLVQALLFGVNGDSPKPAPAPQHQGK